MRLGVMLAICGCGHLEFDALDANADASSGPCTQWGPFAAPVRIAELGALGDDWSPALTADELEVYFSSARSPTLGTFDIVRATRSAPGATFSTPVDVAEVSSSAVDQDPFISEDGLAMVLSSSRGGDSDLWITTRATRAAPFARPELVAGTDVNIGNSEESPWLSPDGLRLYFGSDRLTGGEIFVASRANVAAAFDAPSQLAELGSDSAERRATFSHDELEVFVTSDRGGDYDIYHATRPTLDAPFSTPVPVPELNSTGDDMAMSLVPSGDKMFYAYAAVAIGGDAEIWAATRPCLAR